MSLVLPKHQYVCRVCGHKPSRWMRSCPSCRNSRSFVALGLQQRSIGSRISVIGDKDLPPEDRIDSGVPLWQKLTDGGQTLGTVILIAAGEGSGKSTLMLEVAIRSNVDVSLYVSGEEQDTRVQSRARRLKLWDLNRETRRCRVLHTSITEEIFEAADREHAKLIVVDSAQAFVGRFSRSGKAGSVSEVKRLALMIVEHARRHNTAWVVIGQLTQDGKVAGPRKMPHWFDGVGFIKSNVRTGIRKIGLTKWRDGQTHVWYNLVMTSEGLFEENDPRVKSAVREGEKTATQQGIELAQAAAARTRKKKPRALTQFEMPSDE